MVLQQWPHFWNSSHHISAQILKIQLISTIHISQNKNACSHTGKLLLYFKSWQCFMIQTLWFVPSLLQQPQQRQHQELQGGRGHRGSGGRPSGVHLHHQHLIICQAANTTQGCDTIPGNAETTSGSNTVNTYTCESNKKAPSLLNAMSSQMSFLSPFCSIQNYRRIPIRVMLWHEASGSTLWNCADI